MQHNLKNRQQYPSYHIWESSSKINVYSNTELNNYDILLIGNNSHLIKKIDRKLDVSAIATDELNNITSKTKFYELKTLKID